MIHWTILEQENLFRKYNLIWFFTISKCGRECLPFIMGILSVFALNKFPCSRSNALLLYILIIFKLQKCLHSHFCIFSDMLEIIFPGKLFLLPWFGKSRSMCLKVEFIILLFLIFFHCLFIIISIGQKELNKFLLNWLVIIISVLFKIGILLLPQKSWNCLGLLFTMIKCCSLITAMKEILWWFMWLYSNGSLHLNHVF